MANYICTTCGAQYAETTSFPVGICTICADDRQYVRATGQEWTTLEALRSTHRNELRAIEPGLTGIGTVPRFAIGQRAMLVQTPAGNLLWDCNSLIDDDTVAALDELGGVDAIAISHPHFYNAMVDWSRAFGDAPIYLHESNRAWVMRPDERVRFFGEETFEPLPGLTIVRCGGHFPGSSVLHWPAGARGHGALLTGDTINVVADPGWVTFMYSYPNQIPLNATSVRAIVAAVEPFEFDRLYAGWWDSVVAADAKRIVRLSAERYVAAIAG